LANIGGKAWRRRLRRRRHIRKRLVLETVPEQRLESPVHMVEIRDTKRSIEVKEEDRSCPSTI
jgi:hypothetical protein